MNQRQLIFGGVIALLVISLIVLVAKTGKSQFNVSPAGTRGAGTNVVMGYDQVNSPEQYAVRQRANFVNDEFDPDSRDQVTAYHDPAPPSWSGDSLLFYGGVDAQVIQNHKEFTSENWMFNQNAAFADFGDNPNYPYPVTSIRLNAINNVPTDSNPHQLTEDQDDGGAARHTFTDKQICYGLVN